MNERLDPEEVEASMSRIKKEAMCIVEQEIDLRFNMRSALFHLGKHIDWADHIRKAVLQSILSFVAGGLGDVYLLLGRPDDALPILEKAVEPQNLASSIDSSIHTITALSEAYRLSGQIAKAIDLYRALGMKFWLPKAEAILSELS